MKRSELVAPCGIHCAICPLYLAGENSLLLEALVEKGIPREKLPCQGCRALEGHCPVLETPMAVSPLGGTTFAISVKSTPARG